MIPNRMCAVCRERKEKTELLRITRTKDGEMRIDPDGKLPGRGAYICKEGDCLKNAEKRRVLERSFGGRADSNIYKELSEFCDDNKN